ncbi:MAG TPA: hypothetical protein ENN76_03685, partial [Euryarchaeota archaeon]|nr:hypothetical protein [Euryarchaeota archaeon]
FWTYINLRQPVLGDVHVIMTSAAGSSLDSGQAVTITASVDQDGTPALGSYVKFVLDGVGELSNSQQMQVDEFGSATVTYSAPVVTSPTDVFITVHATSEGYESDEFTLGFTVHAEDMSLKISRVQIAQPRINSGDNTQVTITVVDQDGEPVNNADLTATLSLSNFGGTITKPVATETDGQYTCTFTAIVALQTRYVPQITATKAGYLGDYHEMSQIIVDPKIINVRMIAEKDIISIKEGGTGTTTITITVNDEAGNAVDGAQVTLSMSPAGTDSTINVLEATTDASGIATFTFTGKVKEDTTYRFDVTAQKEGYVSGSDAYNILVHVKPPTDSFIPGPGVALVLMALLGAALVLMRKE